MEELTGRVAVVTGGASGIGLAMGRAFAAEGMNVVLADIEDAALETAVADLRSATPEVEVVGLRCDVADPDQVEALRDEAVARFDAVHLVCNNAGVSTGGPVWEHSIEDWRWMLGVNLWGVINGIRSFTPLLIDQGEGHIVNTASMAGLTSPPFMALYNVTKHAVVTLTETLYADLQLVGASGVGASVLCPGWVQTRIHEAGRNRPEGSAPPDTVGGDEGLAQIVGALIADGIDPADVAAQVVDSVRNERFYVLTHTDWKPMISGRVDRIVAEEPPLIAGLPS